MVKIIGQQTSILNQYIAEVRDASVQTDSMRFRKNLERIGEIFAFRISETLKYEVKEITTPLGVAEVPVLSDYPVLATILRAGLPFHQGFLNIFDRSENAFISAYRKYHKDGRFDMEIEYASSPDLNNKVVILLDPMIATGSSVALAYKELLTAGRPAHTHIVTILASIEGVEFLKRSLSSKEVSIWVGAVDDELTAQAYIVPGLGDAGDLAYGRKI